MATIYRFIVEEKQAKGGSGENTASGKGRAKKGAAKKGRDLPLLGGSRGGVEHNRKMRAINPLLNKVTGGVWEKATRLTRAGIGLAKNIKEGGVKGAFSGPSIAIIIAFVLMTVWNAIARLNQRDRQSAEKLNADNFKRMENGSGTIHGSYKLMVNSWSSRVTYNENK